MTSPTDDLVCWQFKLGVPIWRWWSSWLSPKHAVGTCMIKNSGILKILNLLELYLQVSSQPLTWFSRSSLLVTFGFAVVDFLFIAEAFFVNYCNESVMMKQVHIHMSMKNVPRQIKLNLESESFQWLRGKSGRCWRKYAPESTRRRSGRSVRQVIFQQIDRYTWV